MLTIITNIEKLRMNKLNKYFSRNEFECKCGCGFDAVDSELLRLLTITRKHFDAPLTITSACRCLSHNESVQREANSNYIPLSSRSKHMKGIAADIKVKGVTPAAVYEFLDNHAPNTLGLGKYSSFTHVDVRAEKARW